jgi:hypothetical protein
MAAFVCHKNGNTPQMDGAHLRVPSKDASVVLIPILVMLRVMLQIWISMICLSFGVEAEAMLVYCHVLAEFLFIVGLEPEMNHRMFIEPLIICEG